MKHPLGPLPPNPPPSSPLPTTHTPKQYYHNRALATTQQEGDPTVNNKFLNLADLAMKPNGSTTVMQPACVEYSVNVSTKPDSALSLEAENQNNSSFENY